MSPMIAEVTNQDCKKVDFDLKKKAKRKNFPMMMITEQNAQGGAKDRDSSAI